MDAELLLLFFLLNLVFEHVRSERDIFNVHQYFSFAILKSLNFLTVIFKKKQFRRRLLGMSLRDCLNCNITYCLFFFACLNFELPLD